MELGGLQMERLYLERVILSGTLFACTYATYNSDFGKRFSAISGFLFLLSIENIEDICIDYWS